MTEPIAGLIAGCARREPEAWRDLVADFGPWLQQAVRRALGRTGPQRDDVVEDLVQEAWCRLLARECRLLRGFRGSERGEFALYLGAVATSVVHDRARQQLARKREAGRTVVALAEEGARQLRDPGPSAEDRLLARERRALGRARLRALAGPRVRGRSLRLLELALLHGWTSDEIARRVAPDLAPSSVDSLVNRFRRRMAPAGVRLPKRRCGRPPRL